ncbi:MAG: aminodeoxychorismate synthase component I [Candidatus Omnitrophica bacterium]|nr:aminodeoxychorismate synthase component I [Candidatus Omnitrophota bacterium]
MANMDLSNIRPPFIFLDSARLDNKNDKSYLFIRPLQILTTNQPHEIKSIFDQIDILSQKYWISGYLSYEALYGFEPKLTSPKSFSYPLIWMGVYKKPFLIKSYKGQRPGEEHLIQLNSSMSWPTYKNAIHSIKQHIHRGNTYQVNYTFDQNMRASISGWALYDFLRHKQKTSYCAYIHTRHNEIMSFSPELFFCRDKNFIETKPMKGTIKRGRHSAEDLENKNQLAHDTKNIAENLMIVDLLRNDLGRICQTDSIKVQDMFQVETHPTLHQMTTTIQGQLNPHTAYYDIFRSLFPCGSVTGAPKIKTMQIIEKIEQGKRGVYCGAIGYISPKQKAVFSVPIRTLVRPTSQKLWKYRVGSGIIWDSDTKQEWEECHTKSQFLTQLPCQDFDIFETILWNKRLIYLNDHINRLKNSCQYFAYPLDDKNLKLLIKTIQHTLKNNPPTIIKIMVAANGKMRWEVRPFKKFTNNGEPLKIIIAEQKLDSQNKFLFHKTTRRPWYEKASKLTKNNQSYEVIFFNQRGELCEGSRSNIFIDMAGQLFTPALTCGLLPGILRGRLLKQNKCKELILHKTDLDRAQAIYCGNSVRGLVQVKMV